jgi:hypothetical protein
MGARNPDRIPIEQWRSGYETVAQMQRANWRIIARCRTCHLDMQVDLDLIAWRSGPKTSLWNRTARCRRLKCDGLVDFWAAIPRAGGFHQLKAPIPGDRRGSVTLARLAETDGTVHIYCHAPGCREKQMASRWSGPTLTAKEAGQKWGFDLTLAEIQERYRCPVCGHRGQHIHVEPGVDFRPKTGMDDG